MVSLKNPMITMVMNMNVLTKEQMEQMIDAIEEVKFYDNYPAIIVAEEESSTQYSKDTVALEADGFHTYHVHGGYGLGCFPVHEEFLGFFTGNISDEQLEAVSTWILQIYSDMQEWMRENERLGIDKSLIENVRGMIAYEIEILEDGFHPIFLDQLVTKRIYIGGYHDPSSYGSHQSKYLDVDYINESYHRHVITDIRHGGNGQGCFDVWDEHYGVWYDDQYIGVVYNTLRKWKNMEKEFFSAVTKLSVDYYTPEEGEIVILKNGLIKSSTKDDGRYEGITVFVEFDRMSRSGNPVYRKIGDALVSAIWLRWEEEVETSSKRFLHLYSYTPWFGSGTEAKSRLMKFPGWSASLEYYGHDIRRGDVMNIEDCLTREIFNEGCFIPGDREEEIMLILSDKDIVKEKITQLKIKMNLLYLEDLLNWEDLDPEEEAILEEMFAEEVVEEM